MLLYFYIFLLPLLFCFFFNSWMVYKINHEKWTTINVRFLFHIFKKGFLLLLYFNDIMESSPDFFGWFFSPQTLTWYKIFWANSFQTLMSPTWKLFPFTYHFFCLCILSVTLQAPVTFHSCFCLTHQHIPSIVQ